MMDLNEIPGLRRNLLSAPADKTLNDETDNAKRNMATFAMISIEPYRSVSWECPQKRPEDDLDSS